MSEIDWRHWRAGWDFKRLSPDTMAVRANATGSEYVCDGVALIDGMPDILQPNKSTMEKIYRDAALIKFIPEMVEYIDSRAKAGDKKAAAIRRKYRKPL